MRRVQLKQFLEFVTIFVPILYLVHTNSILGGADVLEEGHRSISATPDYLTETAVLGLTIRGTPNDKPTRKEKRFLEHVLFGFLNKSLNPLKIQITNVEVVDSETIVRDGSSGFTLISHTSSSSLRRKGEMVDPQDEIEDEEIHDQKSDEDQNSEEDKTSDEDNDEKEGKTSDHDNDEKEEQEDEEKDNERELLSADDKCKLASKLHTRIEVTGKDFKMLSGKIKIMVKKAINDGNIRKRELIELFVAPLEAEDYFRKICSISAVTIEEDDESKVTSSFGRNPGSDDNSETISSPAPTSQPSTLPKEETMQTEKRKKAADLRNISLSVFLSLCLTAALINGFRILGRKRANNQQRMAKAKSAFDGPKQLEGRRTRGQPARSDESFVGMLDNGAVPTR
jgi:hypothetical protein